MTSNDKACRNCGGTEHYTREVDANGGHGPHLLPLGFLSFATFNIRVCTGCGLVDWFVPSKHFKALKEKFKREP